MPSTNLPEKTPEHETALEVLTPPSQFVIAFRGSAEVFRFDHMGDSLVAIYEGSEEITTEDGEIIEMATFTGADNKPYCCFPNGVLRRALAKVSVKSWVRITYTADIDTGKPSPLKNYVVEVGA